MTEKRFTVHIRWYNYEKTEGEIELKDNGQPLLISESVEDVRYLKEMLNEFNDENEQLKKQIGNLEHTRDFCAECCERLEKENEQLQSEIRKMQRAYEQLWMHTYR